MKMKKFLGMLLLAGAVAVVATSCEEEEKNNGSQLTLKQQVAGSYRGNIDVTINAVPGQEGKTSFANTTWKIDTVVGSDTITITTAELSISEQQKLVVSVKGCDIKDFGNMVKFAIPVQVGLPTTVGILNITDTQQSVGTLENGSAIDITAKGSINLYVGVDTATNMPIVNPESTPFIVTLDGTKQ